MLNLSRLPADSPPERCLQWAGAFCQALEGGLDARAAAGVADRALGLQDGDGQ